MPAQSSIAISPTSAACRDVPMPTSRTSRTPPAGHEDLADAPELRIAARELAEDDRPVVREPPAHRVRSGFRRFVDLLEHEVGVAALLCLADVPVHMNTTWLYREPVERRDLRAERSHGRDLSLAEHENPFGVRDDRRDVRGDVVL